MKDMIKRAAMLAVLGLSALGIHAASAVSIDLVNIGNAGNAADTTGYGAVAYDYQIGKYEVTIGQYTEFLNAVDPTGTNTNSLYFASMGTANCIAGISYTDAAASGTKYAAIGSVNRPITYVNWFSAARFANWMQNGQGSGSTETGAYTLNGASSGIITKNAGATWYIPSEDEWYKAAFNSPEGLGGNYTLYPTQSNTLPGNAVGSGANQANYYSLSSGYSITQNVSYDSNLNYLTDVGAYSSSASFYGTFDQAGNAREWNDAVIGSNRGFRGGAWNNNFTELSASNRGSMDPSTESTGYLGFRLAAIPEPLEWQMFLLALAVLIGWNYRRLRPLAR